MRLLCSGQSRLNDTLLVLSVARYRRTGIATIPKLMTPRQIERGIPHLAGRSSREYFLSSGSRARPSRASVAARSRKRRRRRGAAEADQTKDPIERRRIAAPVLADDPLV